MGGKTNIVLIVILTVSLTLAFGAIAMADTGKLATEAGSGSTTTVSSGPSLANNISPAPADTAGNTADVNNTSLVGVATGPSSGFVPASNGNPSATIPSSGNTTTGAAAGMFGDRVHGQTVYAASCSACHGPAGQPTLSYPGLADVQDPNLNFSIDPGLYDLNPALFARNIDPFIQHGSNPVGPPSPMPAYGDLQLLSQVQIADSEAYIMSLSNVRWPLLALSGSVLTGSDFVPQSTVQLYLNGVAFGAPITIGTNGAFVMPLMIPANQMVTITANYAVLNVTGIFPNGNPEGGELGLDANRGAALKVASIPFGTAPQPQTLRAASLPSTGANLYAIAILTGLMLIVGMGTLVPARARGRKR